MHKRLKNLCFALVFFAGIAAAFFWYVTPGGGVRWLAIGLSAAAALGLIGFIVLHRRPDIAPDYLARFHGTRSFEYQGVCVAIEPAVVGGIFHLNLFFQGKFTGESIIRLRMRPKQGFLGRPKGMDLNLEPIDCPPAAYGVMRWPVPVPLALQGKKIVFEVEVQASYPMGMGSQVRFRSRLRAKPKPDVQVISHRMAQCKLQLPENVLDELPVEIGEEEEIFWHLGDPPLPPSWQRPA